MVTPPQAASPVQCDFIDAAVFQGKRAGDMAKTLR